MRAGDALQLAVHAARRPVRVNLGPWLPTSRERHPPPRMPHCAAGVIARRLSALPGTESRYRTDPPDRSGTDPGSRTGHRVPVLAVAPDHGSTQRLSFMSCRFSKGIVTNSYRFRASTQPDRRIAERPAGNPGGPTTPDPGSRPGKIATVVPKSTGPRTSLARTASPLSANATQRRS